MEESTTVSEREPLGERAPTPPSQGTRRLIVALVGGQAALFALLGLARFWTFHNETFDLAFYTRIAWGVVRLEFWEPMVNAHIYGLHLSPILAPLGALGAIFGTPSVLIVAQALSLSLAAFPLARIGARHLGPTGALVATIAWLFYPNLGHVAGYEFHPGSLAVLALAWMAYAIDRGDAKLFGYSAIGVLVCREDLALVTLAASALFAWSSGVGRAAGERDLGARRVAAIVGGGSLLYALLFFFVLHPMFAPAHGSLELHFGRFGSSLSEVAVHLLSHPGELLAHLATPERLLYLPKILAPLAFLPLLRARWLVPTIPLLAINLLSDWPTITDLDVHYLTPALPFLLAGALDGAGRIAERAPITVSLALVVGALVGHGIAGGTPLSLDYAAADFRPDVDTDAMRRAVSVIGPDASVQAPYPLLAHVAERLLVHRTSTPEANDDFYVLDVAHRRRFAAREDLLRTFEEPPVRTWLARTDHRLVFADADLMVLERGHSPREGLGARAIVGRADPRDGARLCACLSILSARLDGERLTLEMVARGPCPNDLAVRIGTDARPPRVDLLFGGWLSPSLLESGDRVRSMHRLSPVLRDAIVERGLRVGVLRQSGARPEHADPTSVAVPLAD